MPESTTILRYLGEPFTLPEVKEHPEYARLQKILKKADKNGLAKLSTKELQDLIKLTMNPPPEEIKTNRELVQFDEDGQMIRKFPKTDNGEPKPKRALNGRVTFFPQNDYRAVVTYANAELLLQKKSHSGHDLYTEESNILDTLTTQVAVMKAKEELNKLAQNDKLGDAVGVEAPAG